MNLRSMRSTRLATIVLAITLAAALLVPATAFGQATSTPSPTTAATAATASTTPTSAATAATAAATASATATTGPALSLSTGSGLPGAQITANGSGFADNETVNVTFNGQSVGTPTANGSGDFSLSFTVPEVSPASYGVLATGQSSGLSASTVFTVTSTGATLAFSPTQAAPGTSVTVTATGFRPGETVQFNFNGASVGSGTADTNGTTTLTFTVPNLGAGQYNMTATGATSNVTVTVAYTVLAASTTVTPTAAATGTPAPTVVPTSTSVPTAPPMAHDERYFQQTGYRIDDDQIWSFFQAYGGLDTFGYPVSRTVNFLGCPVQFFQRQIIQVCPSQGPALINLLDPEIFPYTHVNGSVFPGPDDAMKAATPPVSDPNYAADIIAFIQQNVPDQFNGQPVNFYQTFNNLGGLTIWGAPISHPAPDPSNANFIYQRFQRGIMHYIAGTGTESILLADYLKAIITAQNVPPDLLQQSQGSRYYDQYCPGQTLWLCRPNDLPGTDLTYAFVQG